MNSRESFEDFTFLLDYLAAPPIQKQAAVEDCRCVMREAEALGFDPSVVRAAACEAVPAKDTGTTFFIMFTTLHYFVFIAFISSDLQSILT